MKCPKCEKQNKPGVKNCEYCNELMPVRKKKSAVTKKSTADKTTKVSTLSKTKTKTKSEPKLKEIPILELSDEKKELKLVLSRIKSARKLILIYSIIIIVTLSVILFINDRRSNIVCHLSNNTDNSKYDVKIKIKHHKDEMIGFEYITKFESKDEDIKSFKETYETIIENLKNKKNYKSIVNSNYDRYYWKINYYFTEENLPLAIDYIGIDINEYKDNVSVFQEEIEKVGFECK